jgi:hypothetical protein
MGGSGEAQGPIGLGRGGESAEWMGGDRGADPRRGQGAGSYTGWVGCGVCWGMLSSETAARSGTAGCGDSEPSCRGACAPLGSRACGLESAGGGGVRSGAHGGGGSARALGERRCWWEASESARKGKAGPGLRSIRSICWCGQA